MSEAHLPQDAASGLGSYVNPGFWRSLRQDPALFRSVATAFFKVAAQSDSEDVERAQAAMLEAALDAEPEVTEAPIEDLAELWDHLIALDESTQALRDEFDAAMKRLAEKNSFAELNRTLADMLKLMKSRATHEAPAVHVTNEVSPTPINNHVTAPPAPQYDLVCDHDYDSQGRIVRSRMTRVPLKKAG